MKVFELIEQLKKCDQDLDVLLYYDGEPRLICDGGFICVADIRYCENEYIIIDESKKSFVLCQTDDVYNNYKYSAWIFKNENLK